MLQGRPRLDYRRPCQQFTIWQNWTKVKPCAMAISRTAPAQRDPNRSDPRLSNPAHASPHHTSHALATCSLVSTPRDINRRSFIVPNGGVPSPYL